MLDFSKTYPQLSARLIIPVLLGHIGLQDGRILGWQETAREFQEQANSKRRKKLAIKNAKYEAFWAQEKLKPAHLQKQQYPIKVWPENRFSKLYSVNDDLANFWDLKPSEGVIPLPYLETLDEVPGMERLTLTVVRPSKHSV